MSLVKLRRLMGFDAAREVIEELMLEKTLLRGRSSECGLGLADALSPLVEA
jgi:hypothetical protein